MDKTRAKIKATSMTAFVAILFIALMFGIQTSILIVDWLTTGGALSNPDSVRHGMGLLGDGLLVALAVYVALVFLRINREETPFFANLPRKIKAVAVLLFATLAVPKWLYWAARASKPCRRSPWTNRSCSPSCWRHRVLRSSSTISSKTRTEII